MTNEEQIRKILGTAIQYISSASNAILEVIDAASSDEEKVNLLGIAFVERDSVPKQPALMERLYRLEDGEWEKLDKKYALMVQSFMTTTYFSTTSIDEFSKEMLRFLAFFREKNEKIYVLAAILYTKAIMPYKQLPGVPLHMSDAEYAHLLKSNPDGASMIRHLESVPFDTRTQEVSVVLQVIDEYEANKPLRVALLAYYTSLLIERYRGNG